MNKQEFLKMVVERSCTEWLDEPSEQQSYEDGWLAASRWWASQVMRSEFSPVSRSETRQLAQELLEEEG
jgi:hypothetical protein